MLSDCTVFFRSLHRIICIQCTVLNGCLNGSICLRMLSHSYPSDIRRSLMIASLGSLAPSLHSWSLVFLCKVCCISMPLILPTQFIIEKNLQCISPGIPCIWNYSAEGSTLIKLCWICDRPGLMPSDSRHLKCLCTDLPRVIDGKRI